MSDTFRQVGYDLPGSSTIVAADCKRKLSITPQPTATYELSGNRTALLSGRPAVGDVFETIDSVAFRVTKMDIEDEDGGTAKLTITTEAVITATYADPIADPVYTVEFQELRKKIEAHPCCGKLMAIDSGAQPASWERWQFLTASNWKAATSIPTFFSSLSAWDVEQYLALKKKGVEEFLAYYPVLTRTLNYLSRPTDLGLHCGTQQTPPTGAYAYSSMYEWLAGPDNCTRKGEKYERKTSWIGFTEYDALIYPDWSG